MGNKLAVVEQKPVVVVVVLVWLVLDVVLVEAIFGFSRPPFSGVSLLDANKTMTSISQGSDD